MELDLFTPKVGPIAEGDFFTATRDDGDGAMLDEIHFPTESSFTYYKVPRLENFKAQLGQDHCHKVRVGVGEERHVGDETAAVIADNLLHDRKEVDR